MTRSVQFRLHKKFRKRSSETLHEYYHGNIPYNANIAFVSTKNNHKESLVVNNTKFICYIVGLVGYKDVEEKVVWLILVELVATNGCSGII